MIFEVEVYLVYIVSAILGDDVCLLMVFVVFMDR